jgi:pimeloyl-ACP methyl ester carboxylesterase
MLNFTHSLLGRLNRDFRVVILDRPGSGYSTRPADAPATISAQARIISRFCEELELGRPLIVGHSLGGAIALALALNHPERVAGLALLARFRRQGRRIAEPAAQQLHRRVHRSDGVARRTRRSAAAI